MYETIIAHLERLGINKNQRAIIKVLLEGTGKTFTAKELASKTKLSLSRVYSNLSFLTENMFVQKTDHGTTKYYLSDVLRAVKRYLKTKEAELKSTAVQLIDELTELPQSGDPLALLPTDEDFYDRAYEAAKRAKYIKAMSKTPILFFAKKQKAFWRQQLFKLYTNLIRQGLPFTYIVNMPAPDSQVRLSKLNLPKNNKFKARLIYSKDILGFMMTDKEVVFATKDDSKHSTKIGMATNSAYVRHFFESIFDELFEKGKEIRN